MNGKREILPLEIYGGSRGRGNNEKLVLFNDEQFVPYIRSLREDAATRVSIRVYINCGCAYE